MLNSKQLIEMTGMSRATLNNYVALGILPSPIIKTSPDDAGRATRLGYFDNSALDIIQQVHALKKDGLTMAQIAEKLGSPIKKDSSAQDSIEKVSGHSPINNLSVDSSIKNLPGPSYMVNNNFELIWWNDSAAESLFESSESIPTELEARSLFSMLFNSQITPSEKNLKDLIKPHVAASKKRLSQQGLIKIFSSLNATNLNIMKELYDEVEAVSKEPMLHYPVILPGVGDELLYCDLYVCFYREGILFTYVPVALEDDFLLEFLSKRNYVINELLSSRKPHLTNVAVMVADVQNSVRICSELPAEEYFELINDIWRQSEPIFRKFYGTYGKHVGDGMVYYFFPQPDCDYKLNAIECSLELKEMMRGITAKWQARKGWFSEIVLNIGINEGQEWFGSFSAGGHVEFTVLGQTINHASRISDFARDGAVWATKSMLNQIPAAERKKINFGINRTTQHGEAVFVTDSYASLDNLISDEDLINSKFRDIEKLPITQIRSISR